MKDESGYVISECVFDIAYVLSPKNLSDVEGIHNIDYLIGFDQKIPDWFIKIICWERLKLKLYQVLSLSLVSWAFSTSEAILVFLFKTDNEACGSSRIANIMTSFLLSFLESVMSFGRSHDYTTNSIMRLLGDALMLVGEAESCVPLHSTPCTAVPCSLLYARN